LLVKPGKISKDYHAILVRERQERELVDYHAHGREISSGEAKHSLQAARRFLRKMEAFLKSSSFPG
jgi:uncharacterized protein (UPF0332 family)